MSHRLAATASKEPISWTNTKVGASVGRIPDVVSVIVLAIVMAGLANEVELNNATDRTYTATIAGFERGR